MVIRCDETKCEDCVFYNGKCVLFKNGDKGKMNKSILMKAIDTYGVRAQMRQTVEEMAELTQAICKNWRVGRSEPLKEPRKVWENLVEETADCLIMLEQMRLMLGRDDVDEVIEAKIKRLKERLNAREENEE